MKLREALTQQQEEYLRRLGAEREAAQAVSKEMVLAYIDQNPGQTRKQISRAFGTTNLTRLNRWEKQGELISRRLDGRIRYYPKNYLVPSIARTLPSPVSRSRRVSNRRKDYKARQQQILNLVQSKPRRLVELSHLVYGSHVGAQQIVMRLVAEGRLRKENRYYLPAVSRPEAREIESKPLPELVETAESTLTRESIEKLIEEYANDLQSFKRWLQERNSREV